MTLLKFEGLQAGASRPSKLANGVLVADRTKKLGVFRTEKHSQVRKGGSPPL